MAYKLEKKADLSTTEIKDSFFKKIIDKSIKNEKKKLKKNKFIRKKDILKKKK